MKKVYPARVALLVGFATVALSACVDNDYDLSADLDLTVAIGGSEFAIPGGMTEEIKLSKVLEVEEDDIIQVDGEGNYYLYQEGAPTLSKVSVKGFDISSPDITPTIKNLSFKLPTTYGLRAAGSQDFIATVPLDEDPAKFELKEENLPKELKDIYMVYVDMDVDINFSYSGYDANSINEILMKKVDIILPRFFESDELNGGNVKTLEDVIITKGAQKTVRVHIDRFNCTNLDAGEGLDSETQTLKITGAFNMEGTFSANTADYTGTGTPTQIGLTLKADYTLANVKVKKITGSVSVGMDVEPVKLNDIPDFLSDDEVQLDVENPMIYLSLDNQMPLEASIIGTLSSYKNGQQIAGPVAVNIPEVKSKSNQLFCLSPKGLDENGIRSVKVSELPSLIEKIPDEIRFDVDIATTDKEAEIELDKEYNISTGYSLNVPFVFGPNLSIVYKDTIDGWQDDLEDYEIAAVNVTSKVINKIPLDLVFTAEAITTDGSGEHTKLEAVTAKVKVNGSENDNTIKAGNTEGTETPIVIEIKEVTEGGIKQLDGLILRAVAKSGQENKVNRLNENQTIQLKDIKLKVPGGIKVNLN